MKKEYKSSMEQISLSESDRARILANVKKAYEEPETSDKWYPFLRPHDSLLVVSSAWLLRL